MFESTVPMVFCNEWICKGSFLFSSLEKQKQRVDLLLSSIKNNDFDYLVDGLMFKVADKNLRKKLGGTKIYPKWCVAFKNKFAKILVTTVLDVLFCVSKHGKLKPKLKIKTLNLCFENRQINFVTAHNFSYLIKNRINKGSIIGIKMRSQVIPYISCVLQPSKEKLLVSEIKCDYCDSNSVAKSVELFCSNKNCIGKSTKCLLFIFGKQCLNLPFVGIKTCERLAKANIVDLYGIFRLNATDWQRFVGSNVVSKKIVENLKKKKKTINGIEILLSLNLPNISKLTLLKICGVFKNVFELFDNLEKILSVFGISNTVYRTLLDAKKNQLTYLKSLQSIGLFCNF